MTARRNKKRILMVAVVFLFFVAIIFISTRVALAEKGFGDMSDYLDQIAKDPLVNLKRAVSVPALIGQILFDVLGFLGVVCLLLVIYAGLKWMLADGNEETVSEAKKIILYAIIGMLVIMGSYAVTYYVVDRIVGSTLSNTELTPFRDTNPALNIRGIGCSGNQDCEPGYECIDLFCTPVSLDYYCNSNSDCAIYCSGTQTGSCEDHACRCKDNYCDNGACLKSCRVQGYTSGYCDSGNNCECEDY